MVEVSTHLSAVTCCECGILFGIPARTETLRREDHAAFYCPAGHAQSYHNQTEAEKLRDRLARAERDAEWREKEITRERRKRKKAERELEKTTVSVGHGNCPCCRRHFTNLKRHIASKHPAYVENAKVAAGRAKKKRSHKRKT